MSEALNLEHNWCRV